MRKLIAVLPLVAVSACSGGGPETVGSVAAPAGATVVAVNGGSGAAVSSGNSGTNTSPNAQTSFLSVSAEKSFDAIGSFQSLSVDKTNGSVLYSGNASTVRAPTGTVSYNPRDGIFTLKFADTKAVLTTDYRFQDPAHRTDFSNAATPQSGVPDLRDFNYQEGIGGTPDDVVTFFYQRPGTSTFYVSLAGFVRNNRPVSGQKDTYERGAFVFGEQTLRSQVPASGSGTYKGGFLATMVSNPTLDNTQPKDTYFQWIQGSSTTTVDFGKGTVGLSLNGTVTPATFAGANVPDAQLSTPSGTIFNATGSAAIDLVKSGGFAGQLQFAGFTIGGQNVPVSFDRVSAGSSTAGASSIDGAFYGPDAVNVGGNVRIVGGIPDQRVDILGAFTGAKQP